MRITPYPARPCDVVAPTEFGCALDLDAAASLDVGVPTPTESAQIGHRSGRRMSEAAADRYQRGSRR